MDICESDEEVVDPIDGPHQRIATPSPQRSPTPEADFGDEPLYALPVGPQDDVVDTSPEPERKPDLPQAVGPTDAPHGEKSGSDEATLRRKSLLEDELAQIYRQLEQVSMSRVTVKQELYYISGGRVDWAKLAPPQSDGR